VFTVEEIMSVSVQTLSPKSSLSDAKQLMTKNDIHHIPIVDEDDKVVGLVSHRDILAASESSLTSGDTTRNGDDIVIEKFMTTGVTTVDGRASLREAALFLQKHKYGCLPVVTDGELKGIITDSDFVSVAIDLLEQAEEVEPEDF